MSTIVIPGCVPVAKGQLASTVLGGWDLLGGEAVVAENRVRSRAAGWPLTSVRMDGQLAKRWHDRGAVDPIRICLCR
jgi:hypothetical protein